MANFDEAFFDSAFFDEAPIPKTRMAKVKLDLQSRDDDDLRDYATGHKTAMVGNANFTTPDPAPAVFDPALSGFTDAINDVVQKEADLKEAVRVKNEKRAVLEGVFTLRGAYVDRTGGGVESKITSAALEVRAVPVPTTSLAKVLNLHASAGDNEAEIDLGWNGDIKGRRGFFVEMREDVAGTPWVQVKVVTRSSATVPGLTPGKRYLFRVRAFGPDEIVGPWSDEAQQRCP